jgi:hypothetical protein
LIIEGFLGRRSAPCRNNPDEFSFELDMHNRQQSTRRAEANHGVSLLLVATGVLQHKQGVIEDGHGILEGDAALEMILCRFQLVPAKGSAKRARKTRSIRP